MSNDAYIGMEFGEEQQQAADERFAMLMSALDECKERGVSEYSIKTIMFECGVPG